MEDRVKLFLASGKLEEYVYGILDPKDEKEVLSFIKKYPEVKKEYLALQDQLESLSVKQAIKAPAGMKSRIMEALPEKNTSNSATNTSWTTYLAAACIIASILLAAAWKKSNDQLTVERSKYANLAQDCEERTKKLESQARLIAFYNSSETNRYELIGNDLAPEFNAVVFVNDTERRAILTPNSSLQLPENKCLQLWGDVNGEMIPIAVIDEVEQKDYELEINPAFTSLNLTIEEKTEDGKGQSHPDVSQLIANVLI